jgi:FixJ family two-component response regulator
MSGIELAEHLLSLRPDLPVILYTGFQDVPDTDTILRMGVRAVMEKPLNLDEIQAVIQAQFHGLS